MPISIGKCKCGWPTRAVDDQWTPIVFDSEMGEYHLILDCGERGKGYKVLRFCPWCSGALPKSKRGDFFSKPTDNDIADVTEKMQGIETSEQMLAVLGSPSDTCETSVETQFTYRDRWASLELVVQERKRLLSYTVVGKFKHSDAPSGGTE